MDSGAGLNLFASDFADAIGLPWQTAPTTPVTGISGTVNAHVAQVRLGLVDTNYFGTAEIAFAPGIPVPLMGHTGFFEHFEVRFKTANRHYRIHLR